MSAAVRMRMALACVVAAFAGLLMIQALGVALFVLAMPSRGAFDDGGLLKASMLALGGGLASALVVLPIASALMFLSGRHALSHPITYSLIAVGIGLLPVALSMRAPTPETLRAIGLALPALFAAFFVLAHSLKKIGRRL